MRRGVSDLALFYLCRGHINIVQKVGETFESEFISLLVGIRHEVCNALAHSMCVHLRNAHRPALEAVFTLVFQTVVRGPVARNF